MMRIAIGSDPNAAEEKYRLVEFIKRNERVCVRKYGGIDDENSYRFRSECSRGKI